jgi:hypothetical protein
MLNRTSTMTNSTPSLLSNGTSVSTTESLYLRGRKGCGGDYDDDDSGDEAVDSSDDEWTSCEEDDGDHEGDNDDYEYDDRDHML